MPIPEDIARLFPKRPIDLHKRRAGVVSIVGGSEHFVHAPVIAALGARSGGAGLIQLVAPEASRAAAGMLVPEATFFKRTPKCALPGADAIAVGMGLGISRESELFLSRILSAGKGRFVVDADALNIIARRHAGRKTAADALAGQEAILTPHAGEAARLLAATSEDVDRDRNAAVRAIAERYNAVAILKGHHTLVAAPGRKGIFKCKAGNPFMALGGMGDLLSGIVAARWAATGDAFNAACAAVWLHAAASDSLVFANPPRDPSVANTAEAASSLRVLLER